MTLNNFIPTVWSRTLQKNLNKELIYSQPGLTNTEYEGEITAAGDTVKINSIGRVTVGNYTKNTNIGDPETLTDFQQTLVIDQQKFYNFQVDDVDKAQQSPKVMGEAMLEAAYSLADIKDQFVAGFHVGAAAGNLLGNDTTPVVVSNPEQAYDLLVDLGTLLSGNPGIPRANRSVVIPPWFYGLLQKDKRFVAVGSAASDAVLRNGQIGMAAGFMVMESLNVPAVGGKFKIQASLPMARTFASQLLQTEGYRPPQRFADAVKGLSVYGGKLVRPTALAVLTASRS